MPQTHSTPAQSANQSHASGQSSAPQIDDPLVDAQQQGGGGNAYAHDLIGAQLNDSGVGDADAAGAETWTERVLGATSPDDRASLMTETLETEGGAVPGGISRIVELIPAGSVADEGKRAFDSGHGQRASYGVYYDPGLTNVGMALAKQKDDSWFGPVFGSTWVDDDSVPGYIVLGTDALSQDVRAFTPNIVFHESVHLEAKRGIPVENYDVEALEALEAYAVENGLMTTGAESLSAAKEGMTHSLDFKAFFGQLGFDAAGPLDQPALVSLVLISCDYWPLIERASRWDGAREIMGVIEQNVLGVGDHKLLRQMLEKLQDLPGNKRFVEDVLGQL